MSDAGAKAGWKVFGGLSTVLAGIAAERAVRAGWRLATGKHPPGTPESPLTSWGEAIGWATLSGTVVGLARLVATRQAARTWAKASGSLPPGLDAEALDTKSLAGAR
jgi:uncharacterized protein DUF4235